MLISTEAEVRRLARQLTRTDRPARVAALKADLAIEKTHLAKAREMSRLVTSAIRGSSTSTHRRTA